MCHLECPIVKGREDIIDALKKELKDKDMAIEQLQYDLEESFD